MDTNVKSISQIQPSFFKEKKTDNSAHQEMINTVMEFMKDNNYKKWCGRLKKYKNPYVIYDIIKVCRDKKNPQAYFNWMLKNK